jgi:hypothetical protein
MSYRTLIVPGMSDYRRFDIIVTIKRESGSLPDPAQFAVAARRAASNRAVDGDLMFACTAEKVITSMVVAGMPDESSAPAVAMGVVSEALRSASACSGSPTSAFRLSAYRSESVSSSATPHSP